MSKQRNRNSLLTTQSRPSQSNNLKDELISMKYEMNKPDLPLYPLNDINSGSGNHLDGNKSDTPIYPDYVPWKDRTKLPEEEVESLDNTSYLNKGYFENPSVSNEYYSARNIVQATIFSSVNNCNGVLRELSLHLTNAYKTRNEVINKIKFESNNFRIPPRVTLTSSKKEAWLRDLANPNIPLSKIGEKLPHGIRNKILIDSISNRNVPINRALWFTKCVLFGELFLLKKKHQSRAVNAPYPPSYSAFEKVELQWFQEWTQQVVDYLYKFSKEMNSINSSDRKQNYMLKLQYLLKFIESLYIECLLDKNYFLSLVLKLFKEGLPLEMHQISHIIAITKFDDDDASLESELSHLEYNYGQRLVALTLVKVFWKDILKYDYLCKELSELLLLNYFFIQKLSLLKDSPDLIPENIKSSILQQISTNINYLFKCNTNVFIIPNYWTLISETLYEILLTKETDFEKDEKEELLKQLELIKYRNESLMLNLKQLIPSTDSNEKNQMESDFITITRSSDDILKFVHQLDNLRLNDEVAEFLKPSTKSPDEANWRVHLHLVMIWCITSLSNKHTTEGILIICNFIKKRVVQKLSNRDGNNLKIEFENEILEILYNVAENYSSKILDYNLYVLINELYQLKILTISAYLRKLIASGIFHITNEKEMLEYNSPVKIHLSILQNLPVINNKQCNNILQRWIPKATTFKEKLDSGKDILRREFLDKILLNSFEFDFEEKTSSIRNLDVGIKFLLVNWLTNELKSVISASPKLIHINPEIITNIYHLYSWCDNLTVFFKDVIKFLLKNDGGIIITYLDSLYLISRLIMKHFRLIKFLAGSVSEVATGYELFNLIILNYRDLVSREFDYFKFKQVWDFIDSSIEKTPIQGSREASRMVAMFDKEVAESPMKINTHDAHISTRSSERLPLVEFHQNLLTVINYTIPLMEESEVTELHTKLDLEMTNSDPETAMQELLQSIFNAKSEDDETFAVKLLTNLQLSQQNNSQELLLKSIHEFIKKLLKDNGSTNKFIQFLENIILYELVSFTDVISLLRSEVKDEKELNHYINSMIFNRIEELKEMSAGKLIMLTIIRESFKQHHMVKFSGFIRDNLQSPVLESTLLKDYSDEMTKVLEHIIISNTRLVYGGLFSNLIPQDVIDMVHHFIEIPKNMKVNSITDFKNIASHIDEINITMFQLLLRAMAVKDLTGLDDVQQRRKLEVMIVDCLENFKFKFSKTNSFFGELFACLLWEHRIHVLDILECLFLTTTTFQSTEAPYSMTLKLSSEGSNLLPIFNDFFKKFLASSTSKVGIHPGFFEILCGFLIRLVDLLQKDTSSYDQDLEEDLRNGISIFLRILIIHKSTLTSNILTQSTESVVFVRNLLILLNCEFLSKQNDKLKILLHDLLLLMKTSITQEVSLLLENENGELSATSPNVHESTDDKIETTTSTNTRNTTSDLTAIFNFPEPTNSNPLGKFKDNTSIDCCITLDEEELSKGGDIHYFNEANLMLIPSKSDTVTLSNPFGLLADSNASNKDATKLNARPFKMKSFEIFEDSSSAINDGCLNLQFFDAYTTRENPP